MLRELNHELDELAYRFDASGGCASLTVQDFHPVIFLEKAGDGSWAWLKSKHADGAIHEPATVAAILAIQRRFGERVKTVVDIGAAYGYFALICRSVFPDSTVIAFEMDPGRFESLARNVEANRQLGSAPVTCVHAGLSDSTATAKQVWISGYELREGRRWRDWLERIPLPTKKRRFRSTHLDILTLDEYCASTRTSPDLIKLDTEGYQVKILPGAAGTIEKCRPILLLEFDRPRKMRRFGKTNRAVVAPLFELGYRAYWCEEHRNRASRFEDLTLEAIEERHESNSLALFVP